MTIYEDWGFNGSPFQTTSLPASSLGEKLLVGRAKELANLSRRISTGPKIATVEGLNGVGKTSVVNVAAYKLFESHLKNSSGPLLIPCRVIFQFDPGQNVEAFIDHVLMEVAQTLIEQSSRVKAGGYDIKTKELDRWLNQPHNVTYSGGVWVIQGGVQSETNTSQGFSSSGFRKAVTSWLEAIYKDDPNAGVICTIDNLELLQSSEKARAMLEQLRDKLLSIAGLRWVLCGSLGIILGVASSPRLEGYLHPPIELHEVGSDKAKDILDSRVEAYSAEGSKPYLPLTVQGFEKLYDVLKGNLRSVLSNADNYCQWVADNGAPDTEQDKDKTLDVWLANQAQASYEAVKKQLRPRPLEVFMQAVELQIFSPSDFDMFGFQSLQAMRPHILQLEDVGLLVSTQDDGDRRRKTIQVTPKGWLVSYCIQHLLDE